MSNSSTADSLAVKRRLFIRQLPEPLADLPHVVSNSETALPDALRQHQFYSAAFTQMERAMPLQVATLRDQLDRVKAALERFQTVRNEEQVRLQLFNEDARHAELIIDEKVAELREKFSTTEAEYEKRIEERMIHRAIARQVATAAYAAAGMDESTLKTEFISEDDTIIVPSGPIEAPQSGDNIANDETSPNTSVPRGWLGGILRGRFTLTKPVATVEPSVSQHDEETSTDKGMLPHRLLPNNLHDEAVLLARPKEALALQHGLPTESPTQRGLQDNLQNIEWFALVVCGVIFGISVGILIDVLDPGRLIKRPEETVGAAFVTGVIGIAIFWVLGRVARGMISIASECWHAGIATTSQADAQAAALSLRKTGILTLIVGVVALFVLIAIEATVERFGIMGAVEARQVNTRIVAGTTGQQSTIPQIVLIAMALIVSMPFLLLHALHGWVDGKAGTINNFLANRTTESLWDTKRTLHEQRLKELNEVNTDLLKYRREELARIAEGRKPREYPVLSSSVSVETSSGDLDKVTNPGPDEPHHFLVPDAGRLILSAEKGWPLGSVEAALLALAQAREAHFQVRRAQAQKREALAPTTQEIERWESQRQMERLELPTEAKQRIDTAHSAYVRSVSAFDKLYQEERKRYEMITRPGLFWRIRHFFMAQPE